MWEGPECPDRRRIMRGAARSQFESWVAHVAIARTLEGSLPSTRPRKTGRIQDNYLYDNTGTSAR